MRILVINWRDIRHPQAGGAEVHVHEIFRRLVEMDNHVTLLCSRAQGEPAFERVDGIETHRTGNWMNFNLAAAIYYLRHLRSERWDIVVDDVNKIPFYAPLYVRSPVLMLVPHLFGTTVFSEVPFPQASYVFLWERAVPLIYARTPVVAISESTKRDLVDRGLRPSYIRVIQCGIDHDFFRPSPEKGRTIDPMFLYLGRVKRYKRVDILLDATAFLREQYSNIRVEVAGEGDDLDRLRRKVTTLKLERHVRFLGHVSDEEKVRLLRAAYALVVPSPKEGWGITAIEANACGTPVIASKSPGLVDSVKHEMSGLHVPHGDSMALAGAMERLLVEPDLRERLAAGALDWSSRFNWDRTAREMLDEMARVARTGT